MKSIKEGLRFFICSSKNGQEEFEKHNNLLVLSRIKMVSQATIFLAFFWAYMDWIIVTNGADKIYILTLIVIHIICVISSAAFLIFYKRIIDDKDNKKDGHLYIALKIYVFLCILLGAMFSINSQRYTGNIYTYIIILLIAAIAYTLKPAYMLFVFSVNHIIFLIGIGLLSKNVDMFLAIMINSTVLSCVAFLLGCVFYRHRMMEFFYRKELIESEANFKKLFYVNPYPVIITRSVDGKLIEANKRAQDMLEINSEELASLEVIDYYISNDSRQALLKELIDNNSTYNKIVEYEFKGKKMWVTANFELIDYQGQTCILTGIMDITEFRKAEEELTQYATMDSLTGILNRRVGMKKLGELLDESVEVFLEFVLCFIDINNLKHINDTYGHREGDRYILTICDMIRNKINEDDIFFRVGGDEFIIIFRNNKKTYVENFWNDFMKELHERNIKKEFPYKIMASHGVFYYCSGMNIDLESIIHKADDQMYKEKARFKEMYYNKDEIYGNYRL